MFYNQRQIKQQNKKFKFYILFYDYRHLCIQYKFFNEYYLNYINIIIKLCIFIILFFFHLIENQ